MVIHDTTVLEAPTVEEVMIPQVTMDEGDALPSEEETPRNTDPPPAEQTEPSTPPASGEGEGEEGDIKPGNEGMGDTTQ